MSNNLKHTCRVCGHKWESLDLSTAKKIRKSEAVNKNGPSCALCLHLAMAYRYGQHRGFKSLTEVVRWWNRIRSVNKL